MDIRRDRGRQDDDAETGGSADQGAWRRPASSGDDQAARHRADAHRRGEQPVGAGAAVEHLAAQQRKHDGELVGEGADDRHHDQRNPQRRGS